MVRKETNIKRPGHSGEPSGGGCVKIEDMTMSDLKNIVVGEHFDGSCPICGQFHLTRRELSLLDILLT